ncbi:MAG: alcohol dehydrogenase catalytic domain-containing protein [Verrucomicrobia bacterium]|nr:alcohol dehydrogenase catalytic domain-containing protein [Verrucomicrobiota bacterium]
MNALVYDAPRQIVDSGSGATGLKAGQRASASTTLMACGRCFYCRHGDLLACENVDGIGVEVNGAFAVYSKLRAQKTLDLAFAREGTKIAIIP